MPTVDYTSLIRSPTRTAAEQAALASGAGTKSSATPTADYETFLKLLITQMKNQDPTNPMDSTQQVAQLATFSQVEQSIQMNAKLESLMQTSALSQTDIIGRTVTSADGKISGVVREVKLASDGVVAILANNDEVPMVAGVTVK